MTLFRSDIYLDQISLSPRTRLQVQTRLQAGANVPLGRRKGRHKDYKNGDDHRKVPTIRMLLHGFTAAPAQQVPSLCPKRLFREERGIAIRDMGAEATLWEPFVGDNLFWVETVLGAGRLAGETGGAVGDTMQTAVLSLITEEESNADASSTRKAIFSLSNSAEAAVTRYIHGLDVLEPFERVNCVLNSGDPIHAQLATHCCFGAVSLPSIASEPSFANCTAVLRHVYPDVY